MKRFSVIVLLMLTSAAMHGQQAGPSGSYMYSRKDSVELFLNFLEPAAGSSRTLNGQVKPLVIFISDAAHEEAPAMLKALSENGYSSASIACRAIPKWQDAKGRKRVEELTEAAGILSEDACAATTYLADNAEALGVSAKSFVLAGSSAGAVAALQTEWELCNAGKAASLLPPGFRYAGIISFAGALAAGNLKYPSAPAPTMLLHGTADKVIDYTQAKAGKTRLHGSSSLAAEYASRDYNYWILRFEGKGHEPAESLARNIPELLRFLECNVAGGEKRVVDASIRDPLL